MGKRLTTETFIERAREIHGDTYDYSESVYRGIYEPITIKCRKHGEIELVPNNHINGQKSGCVRCSYEYRGEQLRINRRGVPLLKRRLTTEEFIRRAEQVHGKRYDYSEVLYVTRAQKVKIKCPEHGQFEQQPGNHVNGKAGCPRCGHLKFSTAEFIEKAQEVHKNKYEYSETEYVTQETKIRISCPRHGVFLQSPRSHLNGNGCPHCGGIVTKSKKKLTTAEFIEKAKAVHGKDKYGYSQTEFRGVDRKVAIECPHHGVFNQIAYSHLQGGGCAACAGVAKRTIEEAHAIAKARGGECLSKQMNNARELLHWRCANSHEWFKSLRDIDSGGRSSWCSLCVASIGEQFCRESLALIFGSEFPKARPKWLVNSRGNQMELDGYNENLQIAFEYQGQQHFEVAPTFKMGKQALKQRQLDDRRKRHLCKKNGVTLIIVPYTVEPYRMESFLRNQVERQHNMIVVVTGDEGELNTKRVYVGDHAERLAELKQYAEQRGGKCLSPHFIGTAQRHLWRCKRGHEWLATPGNILSLKQWCGHPICLKERWRQMVETKIRERAYDLIEQGTEPTSLNQTARLFGVGKKYAKYALEEFKRAKSATLKVA